MGGRGPDEIWADATEEGERRLGRSTPALLATGAVGGIDVMLGVMLLAVVSGALHLVAPEPLAHVVGSMAFGIAFVLVVIGRSELFTENFLVPIAAVWRARGRSRDLARLWAVTLTGNLVGIAVLCAVFIRAGLIPPEALQAAGTMADTFTERDFMAAFLSAVVAGTVMTLLTWLTHAVQSDGARVLVALLLGFMLGAPSLNHAVVSFGEVLFGLWAGTAEASEYADLLQNFGVAVVGNLVGGLLLVTVTRAVQARGEPG